MTDILKTIQSLAEEMEDRLENLGSSKNEGFFHIYAEGYLDGLQDVGLLLKRHQEAENGGIHVCSPSLEF